MTGKAEYGCCPRRTLVVERLANGGFETGDMTRWVQDGWFPGAHFYDYYEQVRPRSGNSFLGVFATAQLAFLSQTVITAAGQPHRLSLWLQVRRNAPANTLFTVQLQPAPKEATALPPENAPALQPGTAGSFSLTTTTLINTWTVYHIDFTPATGSTTIRLGFQGRAGTFDIMPQFVVDDVSLTSGGLQIAPRRR